MLLSLHIKNYALIEDLDFEFSHGLNIFTGETGAGKSIIIESLGLILGERASSQVIRKGENRCSIIGEFEFSKIKDLVDYLKETAIIDSDNDGNLILRREIDSTGKSKAFVNDKPVSLDTLERIGTYLVDVHGQNEHQTLLKRHYQRQLLDNYGDLQDLVSEVSYNYNNLKQLIVQKNSLMVSSQEKERLVELYSFQKNEIDNAKLSYDEEQEIEQELPKLKNAEKLLNLSEEAYQILYGIEGSIIERLNKVKKLLENINNLGGNLKETSENIEKSYYQLEEATNEIADFRDSLRIEPDILNQLLERQNLIQRLKKKYGNTIGDILSYRDKISVELESLSKNEENIQELEKKIKTSYDYLIKLCEKLSVLRKKASEKFEIEVEKELSDLGMKKAQFKISFKREDEPTYNGIDIVEFLFSANPGEELQPLRNIASGGETSRVMLALKTVLTKADRIPVLIFDEIDAGIGGPMGQTVGKKLKKLSMHHQTLCITHLPQIAAFADNHISVEKHVQKGHTFTKINTLNNKDRIEEIARMLSGKEVTPSARKHAAELIENI